MIGVDCFNDNYQRPFKLRNLESSLEHAAFDFVPIDLSRGDLEVYRRGSGCRVSLGSRNLVSRSSWGRRFETYVRNNVLATQHLLKAMRRTEMKPLVPHHLPPSVYGDTEDLPTSEDVGPPVLAVWRHQAERRRTPVSSLPPKLWSACETALPILYCLRTQQRPDMAFTRFLSAALCKEPITIFGDGSQGRDFTYTWGMWRRALERINRDPGRRQGC